MSFPLPDLDFQWYAPIAREFKAIQINKDTISDIVNWLNRKYRDADHLWAVRYNVYGNYIELDDGWSRNPYAKMGDWITLDPDNDMVGVKTYAQMKDHYEPV